MNKKKLCGAIALIAAFVFWTMLLLYADVQTIGPQGTAVGFATVNNLFHSLTGVHLWLYVITDWLGLVPVGVGFGFAVLGLVQWIKRKQIYKVDFSLLVLGGFYIIVLAAYLLFEEFAINYRPVLIDGYLEASYPSSTTLLVLCVMTTANMQLKSRIQSMFLRRCTTIAIIIFMAVMVIGRLLSGVHWLTDIIGGVILSAGLVMLYDAIVKADQSKTTL